MTLDNLDQETLLKKKILRIIARLNIGGPAIHTVLLTRFLPKNKYESLLVTGSIGEGEGDMLYFAKQHFVDPIIIPELSRKITWQDDLRAFCKIYSLLSLEKPDIVHTHTAKAGTLGRLAALLYNLKRKVLFQPHCITIHTFHGHVFHSYFSPFKTFIFLLMERFLAFFTDTIVVISQKQREDIAYTFKVAHPDKVKIVPLGFDLTPFLTAEGNKKMWRKQIGADDEKITIGIVGRLVPVKNHLLFLEVAKKICSTYNNVTFLIIGDGELREELSGRIKKYGLENLVIFTGWEKEIEKVYDSLDIVALTSLNEGTPVSLIEAMASKKPIIATDAGGVRDVLDFPEDFTWEDGMCIGEQGVLVENNNVDAFYRGVKALLEDASLREKMGEKGRESVKVRFHIDRLVENITKMYEAV